MGSSPRDLGWMRLTPGDAQELTALIEAGGFWRLVPDDFPRVCAKPNRSLLEEVRAGLERKLTMSRDDEPQEFFPLWKKGDLARDTVTDRVGRVMGRVGPSYQLRGLTGGVEWDAEPGSLEEVPLSEALSPQVDAENSRSSGRVPRVW
ncbi:hypothetical protein [Streptomyces sp. NPDC058861]|uniref:hypothetical protein n=1 Tax=Streptomyces sp. NPDC058861 TaxID=3346653 RepID=UPI0036B27D1A